MCLQGGSPTPLPDPCIHSRRTTLPRLTLFDSNADVVPKMTSALVFVFCPRRLSRACTAPVTRPCDARLAIYRQRLPVQFSDSSWSPRSKEIIPSLFRTIDSIAHLSNYRQRLPVQPLRLVVVARSKAIIPSLFSSLTHHGGCPSLDQSPMPSCATSQPRRGRSPKATLLSRSV